MCIQCIYTHTLPAATHHQLFVILSMITCWLEWDTHNALTRGTDCVSTLPHINQRGCTHTMTYMYYTHTCKHTQRHLMAQSMMLSLSLMKNERTALFVYSRVCFWLSCLFSTPVLLHRYFVKAEENISLQVCFCDEVPQVKPSCIHVMSTCSNYYPYAVNKRSTSRCTQEQCILYTPCSFSD